MIPDPADRPLLTVDESLEALDHVIGRSAFYDAIRRNEIPGVRRVGRRILLSTVQLREWAGVTD
jgi:hypothetical protein